MKKKTDVSLSSQSLGNKLRVAVSLMSVLPLLVSFYLVANYIIPRAGLKFDIVIFLAISVLIAISGYIVIKEVIDRVISVSGQVKMIAAGDMDRKVDVKLKDELGDLSEALNQITQRVRTNMEELQVYGKQTDDMNTQVQRRLLVLASVLQITSLISQRESLDKILQMIIEKAKLLAYSDISYLLVQEQGSVMFSMKKVFGVGASELLDVKIPVPDTLFADVSRQDTVLILD
ncbi:MAG: HAMP domain-containing protein, partial [Candidatus Omnitrophota bacterium]